jgi:hypothetical protein
MIFCESSRTICYVNVPSLHKISRLQKVFFGQDIETLQWKTIRKKSARVIGDYISVYDDILKTHQVLVLSVNIMMISKIMFLVRSSHDVQFVTVTHLEMKVQDFQEKRNMMVVNLYARRDLG